MPAVDVDLASGAGQPTPPREPTLARVLAALRGLGERRAVVALLAAALSGTLVGGILTVAVSIFGGFVAVLAGIVVALALAAGLHAAGLLQMDAERGIGQRSVADALAQGLQALPLLIGVALAVLAAVVAVLVAVALVLALSRVPLLGPVLFAVVFPLSIVAVGATIAVSTMALAFAMGALWQGASPMRALAQTLVVLRRRTVATLARFVALGFVVAAAAGAVFGVLSLGFGPVAALAAGIVGGGPVAVGAGGFGPAAFGGGGAHVAAGAIGSMLLWAAALSLVAQVWLRGVCGVYLDMSEGVDASASEALLRDRVDEARRRAATATAGAVPVPAPAGPRRPQPPETDHDRTVPVTAPPWEESTSPSASAVSSPTQFDRLQRAAFGDGAEGATPPRATSPTVAGPTPASASAVPFAALPAVAAAAPARPAAASAPPPAPSSPAPAAAAPAFDPDDDTTLPPTTFRTPVTAPPPRPAALATDIDLPLDADPPASAAPAACPACGADVTPDDLFCNRCGHRLRAA